MRMLLNVAIIIRLKRRSFQWSSFISNSNLGVFFVCFFALEAFLLLSVNICCSKLKNSIFGFVQRFRMQNNIT